MFRMAGQIIIIIIIIKNEKIIVTLHVKKRYRGTLWQEQTGFKAAEIENECRDVG